jgi:fructokinase
MSFRVVGIGEVLWDLLPVGRQLGGAPANFAYHAQALGARASVVTRVGRDALGEEIVTRLRELGLADELVQRDAAFPTGCVSVTLNGDGIPHYEIHKNAAWDHIEVLPAAVAAIREADAVCFGTLAQRGEIARRTIRQLLAATAEHCWRVFDINLRQDFYSLELIEESLRRANVLKLNDGELPQLAKFFNLGNSPREQIEEIAEAFDLRLVALTCGSRGSLLFQAGEWSEQPPQPVQVVDTIGAGDAFTAALVVGLLAKRPLDEIHAAAAEVARHVCTRVGATPLLPAALRTRFITTAPNHLPSGSASALPV